MPTTRWDITKIKQIFSRRPIYKILTTTKLILIRHGQTPWSVEKKYCGHADIGLDKTGIRQAEKLRKKLRLERIDVVYSSDSKRALTFAKIVFRGMLIRKKTSLREMNFGIFEGLTHRENIERHPENYLQWLSNPAIVPGGEGFNEFQKRIRKALAMILFSNQNKTVAIITHEGPIKIIIGDILNSKNIWGIKTDLGCFNIIEFRGKKDSTIKLLNG